MLMSNIFQPATSAEVSECYPDYQVPDLQTSTGALIAGIWGYVITSHRILRDVIT